MTTIPPKQSTCRVGLARRDITPPVGMYHRMWGAAKHDRSTGIHRPLLATVVIFQNISAAAGGETMQVLVAVDHCVLDAREVTGMKAQIEAATGLKPESVVVICSHTHAAGLMSRDRTELPGGAMLPRYLDDLQQTVAELAAEARGNLQDVTITYGEGSCDLARHRDFWDAESGQWVCGLNPQGEADDKVVLARISDASGALVATVVNYACHPTTLAWDNTLVSPDYPGAMREVLEQAMGVPCIFVQGAAGDVGPREGFVGETAIADRNGQQLGYAALSSLVALSPPNQEYRYRGPVVSGATIGQWECTPLPAAARAASEAWMVVREDLPLRYRAELPTLQQVEADRARHEEEEAAAAASGDVVRAGDCRALIERCTRLESRLKALPEEAYPYRMVTWRMGDAVWIAVQGEPYNLFQRELRRRFPNTPIVVATVADSWGASYLPPRELFGSGIYQESIAVLEAGCLEQVIEQAERQIRQCLDDGSCPVR